MKFRRSDYFKKAFQHLPADIQAKAAKAFALLQSDPHHPSLGIKKIQGASVIWEGRIDRQYRFTFHFEEDETSGDKVLVFRNIDNHDVCLKNP